MGRAFVFINNDGNVVIPEVDRGTIRWKIAMDEEAVASLRIPFLDLLRAFEKTRNQALKLSAKHSVSNIHTKIDNTLLTISFGENSVSVLKDKQGVIEVLGNFDMTVEEFYFWLTWVVTKHVRQITLSEIL